MGQIAELLASPLPDYYYHELRLDISTYRIDFQVPAGTHLLYAKERFEDPGLVKLCFEYETWGMESKDLSKPSLYMVAGKGYIPDPRYELIKEVDMADGLRWFVYLSVRD